MSLIGDWINEFGSVMSITEQYDGIFHGTYSSHTGATGSYKVVGVYDTSPDASLTLSFSISWRDNSAPYDPSFHWVSSFVGQKQLVNGLPTIFTRYLLQKNTENKDNWKSTIIADATFKRMEKIKKLVPNVGLMEINSSRYCHFELTRKHLSTNGATPWVGLVEVGEPTQKLHAMFDTGSTHSWFTSSQCFTSACNNHNKFNAENSETFCNLSENESQIDFGPWGAMSANLGRDIFSIKYNEQFINQELAFYLADNYDGKQFYELACDGGISFPSILPNQIDSTELLPLLKNEAYIDYPIVSFYMNRATEKGHCIIGAFDSSKFNDQLNIVKVKRYDPIPYLWCIDLDSIGINGVAALNNIDLCLDTGSSRFKGDKHYIQTIINTVTYNGALPDKQPLDFFDFDIYPDLELEINNQTYKVPPFQYFTKTDNGYVLSFHIMDGLDGLLLVGSVFLETVYSIFFYKTEEVGQQAIGLARLN